VLKLGGRGWLFVVEKKYIRKKKEMGEGERRVDYQVIN